jgi:hypothetical protein
LPAPLTIVTTTISSAKHLTRTTRLILERARLSARHHVGSFA